MQKILYENLRGERTELCGPPYLLEHVTGLGATDAEIVTTQGARQSGVTTRRASRGKRIVKAKIAIYGAGTRREMYELRRELCRKLALRQCFDERTGEMGRLMYENDAGAYWAYALPETPAEDGTRFLNHLNAMTLSFQCDSPYLSEFTQNRRVLRRGEGGLTMPFSFPIRLGVTAFAAECENAGAVDAPVDIEIEGSGEKPEIINETTGAVIRVERAIPAGERLQIRTDPERLCVTILHADGTEESAFGYLDAKSAVTAFTLRPGRNRVRYVPDGTAGASSVTLTWRTRHEGV